MKKFLVFIVLLLLGLVYVEDTGLFGFRGINYYRENAGESVKVYDSDLEEVPNSVVNDIVLGENTTEISSNYTVKMNGAGADKVKVTIGLVVRVRAKNGVIKDVVIGEYKEEWSNVVSQRRGDYRIKTDFEQVKDLLKLNVPKGEQLIIRISEELQS